MSVLFLGYQVMGIMQVSTLTKNRLQSRNMVKLPLMNAITNQISDTEIELQVTLEAADLMHAKEEAVKKLAKGVKVPGFRAGKAPKQMVEKQIDPNALAEETLNHAVNDAYGAALKEHKLSPIGQPSITVTKFVPFTEVEFTAKVEQVKVNKLTDYKKLTAKYTIEKPTKKDIDNVIENMRTQMAERKDVERAAKLDDQAWINFEGVDEKSKPVNGAKGDNYPLMLGSNSFIPGFEDNVVGMKPGEEKTFTLTFPKDYGVKALQSRKVTFTVTLVKLQEMHKPEVNDAFAQKIAPELKTVEQMRKDIEAQLTVEAESKAKRAHENALVAEIVEKSDVALPATLIEEQAENVMRDLTQNLLYRGQTMQEYLDAIGMTAEEQREKEILPEAERRLRAGILLSEIAEKENIIVTPDELKAKLADYKARYASDAQMQAQLDTPEAQREIGAQVLTEKTLAAIVSNNTK